jgi:hypothetical protein
MGIETDRILATIEERKKWIERRENLRARMESMSRQERKNYKEELDRLDQQIAYYDALIRDMKKDVSPGDLNGLMQDLNR